MLQWKLTLLKSTPELIDIEHFYIDKLRHRIRVGLEREGGEIYDTIARIFGCGFATITVGKVKAYTVVR